jgi:hypothetical protein
MRKIKLLFAALLSMMAWTGVMAQTDAEYNDALVAITDGNYYITTEVGGITYYVTTAGALTATKADGGIFAITQKTGGALKDIGFRIYGTAVFTNPPLLNNAANLNPGSFSTSTGNDRNDWERQVLYLNSDGKYAIRSCNTQPATSSWGDAGRTFWTYSVEPVAPQYSYDPAYVWNFVKFTGINVTYEVYDGLNLVGSKTVLQEPNSDVKIPETLTGQINYGGYQPYAYYTYTAEGTIEDQDCTIRVTRTNTPGVVTALTDLSNTKAYTIACDRGSLLTKDDAIASTSHATLHEAKPGKFAILAYESNYYIYSVADGKFVLNDGSLGDMPTHGVYDAIQMAAQTQPYFLFTFKIDDNTTYGLNTNGTGALNGCVINSWTTPDPGDQYYMIEAADFDPTNALAALEAFFHPSYFVTYVVKDAAGKVLFTSAKEPTMKDAHITTLPADLQRTYYTYSDVDVTISQLETTVEFTATWNGPFEISTDFAHAHWYDMAMRGIWYVTSAVKDGDGAYKTQEANTMGLVEDSYQWAFLGNGYDGFKIINKAEGEGVSLGWTDATKINAGVPTIMSDSEGYHGWKIVPSTNTSVPANSFCLNVPGTNLYINQYGGKGGSVKFWDSTGNIGDDGSAFTVFDVPTNFASFVVDEIAPYFPDTEAKYFVWTDAAKTAIGYKESYKNECSFEQYKAMKEALAAALTDANSFVLPETGYYILKNKNYNTYLGIDPSDLNLYGNYAAADKIKNIVKLTKNDDNTYSISLEGVFAPINVAQSQPVTASVDAGHYVVSIPELGYGAFQADPNNNMSVLHCAASGDIVGWEAAADASKWEVIDAVSFEYPLTDVDGRYLATAYFPCPVSLPDGVTAYVGSTMADPNYLTLVPWGTNIAAETAVILEGTSEACTIALYQGQAALMTFPGNAMKGTCVAYAPGADETLLTLQVIDNALGFYGFSGTAIPANKAYMPWTGGNAGVKIQFGDVDGINGVINAETTGEIFNVAGQRLAAPQKGINIINGKKVLVK